jgi:phosphate transport system permease protein
MSSPTVVTEAGIPKRKPASILSRLFSKDSISYGVVFLAAGTILAITLLLVIELSIHGADSLEKFGFSFLVTSTWDPLAGQFGALPFIYGTVVTSMLALLMAVPFGLAAAIFLAELAPPKISDALTFLIELLAAVPSVIFGLIGIFVLVPILNTIVPFLKEYLGSMVLFSGPFYGLSILTAGVVLAIMITPFIISVSREVLLAVPQDLREAALALGATRWETTWQVVVPYARTGIFGSVFLALARALGETMAVTMVVGNSPRIVASLLAPGYSIAAVIANEFSEATGKLYTSALIELGLVLFALTIVLNGAARLLIMATTERHNNK